MKKTIAFVFFLSFLMLSDSPAQSQKTKIVLKSSDALSRTGHFQLSWQYDGVGDQFELQESIHKDFRRLRTIYEGPDNARAMSGLPDGSYYYRVRVNAGDWSDFVTVTVEHYPLSTAFTFLGLGAIVFLATAVLIIRGHIKHRNDVEV